MDDETLGDALDVLRDVVLWELTPQRWDQVGRLIGQISAAYAGSDPDGVREAIADLELNGPVRALRIGTTTVTGVPEPVLDRCNELVHTLVAERAGQATGKGVDGAREDG
ncbi:CATRA system-associated protein [Actinoplanes sp. NPDC026623]|jgi:hypothetical protein|uniref:CATRA system-associated protein n=1 Tax=Actinoplanes sp. NPDC026623 TaxID=3155610 RepID=UPI0033CA75A6